MAHGGCFGIGILLIFCIVAAIQNQSRVYNVQAEQSYRSSRAMGDRAASVIFCGYTPFPRLRVWVDDVQVKSIKVVVMPPDGLGKAEVVVRLHRQHGAVSAAELLGANV